MVLSAYDYTEGLGMGPGHFDRFINQVFLSEQGVNTIGEVNRIAFNDFVQIFVELGYPGILSMVLLFVGLAGKRNLFSLLALASILWFMFPLQYIETTILFAFTISLLRSESTASVSLPSVFMLFPQRKTLLLCASLMTTYIAYNHYWYARWSAADEKIITYNQQEKGLSQYNEIEKYLNANDEFYLRKGVHALNAKAYNAALRAFKKANRLNPSYQSFIHLGDCYFEMNFFAEAIQHYKQAQRLRPEHLYPSYKTIYCYFNQQKLDHARTFWSGIKKEYQNTRFAKVQVMYAEIEELLNESIPGFVNILK